MNLQFMFESEARDMIERAGINDLLDFLHKSDFYTAPASTRYHGAEECGLVKHSLAVYRWIFSICFDNNNSKIFPDKLWPTNESMAIVSLFHDLCKINIYKTAYRNQKNPDTGIWEQVPYYTVQDDSGFGAHGAKSVFLINQFMRLTEEETVAIYHHMGAWDKSTYSNPRAAYEKYPLAWLLHVADEAATYISNT